MTRNVTDLSSRLRCNQPATQTRSPTCALRSLARTRMGVMGTPGYSWLSCPLGVRARRELAVPPHFAGPGAGTGGHGLVGPITGAGRRGIGPAACGGGRYSPHSGGSSLPDARPPFQLPAALCARDTRCYSSPSARWRQCSQHRGRRVIVVARSEEHTSELQSRENLVCRLLLE